MPRMDGHSFLKEVRSDPNLKDATVFIFTSSDKSCYENIALYFC